MKRLILFAAVAVLATGCGGMVFRSPADIANRVRIGMSVDEFKRLAGQNAELDAMTLDYSVYRIEHFAGPEDNRYVSSVKLYRFDSKERLVEVETRDLPPPFFRGPRPGHPDFKPLQ